MAGKALQLACLLVLVCIAQRGSCQTVGLFSTTTNETLASFVTFTGNVAIESMYQPENDLPEQRAALKALYDATGGPQWSPTYSSTVYLDQLALYAALSAGTYYLSFAELSLLLTFKVPWFQPGYSYCRWWGVTCCFTASESVLPYCKVGLQSVGGVSLLGANLNGSLPAEFFDGLPDLSLLFVGHNPGLTGQIKNVPEVITANMLIVNLITTSLQNKCATPSADGRSATWNGSACFDNLFLTNTAEVTSVGKAKPGLSCPGVSMQRPSWLSPLTTAYNFQFVYADPMLVSYFNCTCAAPLRARYSLDSAGLFQMECADDDNHSRLISIVVPLGSFGLVLMCVLALLLAYRTRLQHEWHTMRINNLKRRHAPGTLMERNTKGMEVFHKGMSIVMTDVEGSTALWEWNSRIMNSALGLHDHTLRSLLPRYFGYEVTTEGDAFVVAFHDPIDAIGWALHVQLALLEAPWPPELLQHPQAQVDVCPQGKLLFRGLRVRVAINTGVPAEIIVHNVTKQVEYRGEMVELTEALTHLPAGGQVVLSDTTYQRTKGRLLEVQLPAFTFTCARNSLEAITNRSLSKMIEQSPRSSADTPSSADALLRNAPTEFSPHSAIVPSGKAGLQQAKRAPWFSFKQAGGSLGVHTASKHDLHIDVSTEDMLKSRRGNQGMRRHSTSVTEDTTALASEQHSSCTIIDMGNYLLSECRNRPYTAEDAALPPIAGEHVVQVLPQALVERAGLFPPMDVGRQVAPSLFDAPGAQAAGNFNAVTPKQAGTNSSAQAPAGAGMQEQTEVAFACVSEFGFKEAASIDKQLASVALTQFKSCVRTTLLLCDGYECQETEGAFLVAFNSPRAALEWALCLQMALLRVHWSEALLSLAPTHEELSSAGQVLFRGLSAKIGLFHGLITRLSPHGVTGRADYLSTALDRAQRLWTACNAGQVLVEKSLVDAVGLEWRGIQGVALPSESSSHLALRNHALLMHRVQSDLAAAKLASTTSSISGVIGRHMIGTRRQSTMPKLAHGLSLRTDRSSRSLSFTSRTSLSRQPSRLGDANMTSHTGASLTGPLARQHTAGGHSKPRRSSMLQPSGAPAELQIHTSDYEGWDHPGGLPPETPITSPWTPRIAKVLSGKWYTNQAYRLTGSLSRGNSLQGADAPELQATSQTPLTTVAVAGIPAAHAEAKQEGIDVEHVSLTTDMSCAPLQSNPMAVGPSSTAGTASNGPAGAIASSPDPVQLPAAPVTVHVHHMGQYSFKGTADKFQLCQAFPASLSERMASCLDVAANSNGKLVCIHKDDSMALSVSVMLPDILQLPLAAEPPLYLNVIH